MMFQGFGFGGAGFGGIFLETYRCYSIATCGKKDKEKGDKIILPASAFERLAQMTISYPMQFELRNTEVDPQPVTHVGVLEFTASEGRCYVPWWIMQNLLVPEGGVLTVKNVTLPLASYIKFRPQSVDFLDISNPKAVLEATLRNFSCMTKNDMICLPYNGKNYYLEVTDVQPKDAVSIVEADVKVDFDTPVGYEEQDENLNKAVTSDLAEIDVQNKAKQKTGETAKEGRELLAKANEARVKELEQKTAKFVPFAGEGIRVDGKIKNQASANTKASNMRPKPKPKKSKWSSKGHGTWGDSEGRKLG